MSSARKIALRVIERDKSATAGPWNAVDFPSAPADLANKPEYRATESWVTAPREADHDLIAQATFDGDDADQCRRDTTLIAEYRSDAPFLARAVLAALDLAEKCRDFKFPADGITDTGRIHSASAWNKIGADFIERIEAAIQEPGSGSKE